MNSLSVQYEITAKLDLKERSLLGFESVKLLNPYKKPIKDLTVCYRLPPINCRKRLSVELDEEKFPLTCIEETRLEFEKYFLIKLPTELQPNEELELTFNFSGKLPTPKRGLIYLRDFWYPKLILNGFYVSSYEVKVVVPEECFVASSGVEIKVKNIEEGLKECSSKVEKAWRFGMVLGDEMRYVEERVKGVLVRSYYISETEKWGEILLNNACDVIEFYQNEFGFYPHETLNVIPGYKGPTGGFPLATNVVAIHDLEKLGRKALEFSKWIVAHEIGHMYWGHYVLPYSLEFPSWLWIGLGIYMDRHYSEAKGLSLKRYRRGEEWSFIQRYLDGLKKGYDTTMVQPPEKLMRADFDWNNVIVHGKGYAVISMLEQLLGKDVFRRVHDEGLKRYAYREMSCEDFKRLCEEISGEDLGWFFYQWLYTNRFLSYRIVRVERSTVNNIHKTKVVVERVGSALMSIPVVVTLENDERAVKWTDRRLRINKLMFETTSPVKEVELDPEGVFPLLDPKDIPEELIIAEIYRNFNEHNFSAMASLYELALEKEIKDPHAWFQLGLSLYDVERYQESIESFKRVIRILKDDPKEPWVAWSYIWIGHVLDILRRREEAIEMYQKAINTKSKIMFQFAQYNIGPIDAITWAKERIKEPFTRTKRAYV